MSLIVNCSHCGISFQACRSSAKFCSGNCRVKSFNKRRKAADPAVLATALRKARISSAFPYIGSKGSSSGPRLMELIRDAGGSACSRWIEPFTGSGGAYLSAVKAGLADPAHAVLNDRCRWIIPALKVIRDQPRELAELLRLTPLSTDPFDVEPCPDWSDLQVAVWWLTRCHTGFVGSFATSRLAVDHGRGNSRVRRWLELPDKLSLLAQCFRGPYLQQMDALAFLRRHCRPGDLAFIDPPYIGKEASYAAGDWSAHDELAELLLTLPAQLVAVTYYDHPEVRRLYPESCWIWNEIERPVTSARSKDGQPRERRTELLLIRRDS